MEEPHPFPWKAAQSAAAEGRDPLIEPEQNWKLENEILDMNLFAYQSLGKN